MKPNSNSKASLLLSRFVNRIKFGMQNTILWVTGFTLGIAGAMLYSFYLGLNMATRYTPVVHAATELKLEATTAHLWFEEIISGDPYLRIEEIWQHLDEAEWYARAMLEGGVNHQGEIIPLETPALRQKIQQVLEGLDAFRSIAQKRWDQKSDSGVGSDIDQALDSTFDDFLIAADAVKTTLRSTMDMSFHQLRIQQALLIAIIILLGSRLGFLLLRHERLHSEDLVSLQDNEMKLLVSEIVLKEAQVLANIGHWQRSILTGRVTWSDQVFRIYGFQPGAFEPTGRHFFKMVHRDDRKRVLKSFRDALHNPASFDFRIIHKDGTIRDIFGTVRRNLDCDGQAVELFGIIQDITERLAKEKQLMHTQKMDLMGQMAGGVAHDFNNLLTVVIGNLEFLRDKPGSSLKDDDRELITYALDSAQSGAQLTQGLLTISRKQTLQPKHIEINEFVKVFIDFSSRTLGKPIEIISHTVDHPLYIYADPVQLENALLNLGFNSRDAMPDGGVLTVDVGTVSVTEDNPGVLHLDSGEYVVISVSDTGAGMSEELVNKIEEPFFTTKGTGLGTGLGLSSVCEFAKQSNGAALISSEIGKGTTVSLHLPLIEPVTTDQSSPSNSTPSSTGKETILVVEDEPTVRMVAIRFLTNAGYEVLEAEEAATAIKIFESRDDIDMLFSDINIPGNMNGQELAQWATLHRPEVKLLLTSGFFELSEDNKVVTRDNIPLLKKPYPRSDLLTNIRSLLDA